MAELGEMYVNGIRAQLNNYFAAWMPNAAFSLGDVGVLEGSTFKRLGNLEDMNIPFEILEDTSSTSIDLVSEEGVNLVYKAAGEINNSLPNVPQAKAGVAIEFGKKAGFVFKATETYEPSIKNVINLQNDLVRAFTQSKWQTNWVVIVRLVKTPLATILVSKSSQSLRV